jgi:hypothetical protein
MIPPAEREEISVDSIADGDVVELFGQITDSGDFGSKREVARVTGERLGLTARQVYEIMERNKLAD